MSRRSLWLIPVMGSLLCGLTACGGGDNLGKVEVSTETATPVAPVLSGVDSGPSKVELPDPGPPPKKK